MYDQIQALLTNTINLTAIAGLGGIIAHALYNWHLSQIPTAPKANPDYKPSQLVTEILESQKAEQPSDPTEPGGMTKYVQNGTRCKELLRMP